MSLGIELGEVDYRILMALQEDGRFPIQEIAKRANVSDPTVRSRIKHLMDVGVIKRFTILIDHQKISGGITAFINLKGRITDLKKVGEAVKNMDEVMEAHFTSGEQDLIIKVCVPDLRSLEEFALEKLSRMPGIEYVRSNIITETVKERYDSSLCPGYNIRIQCHTCKKEIRGNMVKMKYYELELFFCCTSCESKFKKEREEMTESGPRVVISNEKFNLDPRLD